MLKNKLGEDSLMPIFLGPKIRRRDGIESLTILEEGEFNVGPTLDGYINNKV